MKYVHLIGYLGADAEVRNHNNNEFTTFRVSHTDRWTGQDGVTHETVEWVDVILNGRPKVVEYLKRGTQVCVIGTETLRVYSSAKERCMKAGSSINARHIELIGGKTDPIPSRLFTQGGAMVDVVKYYWADTKEQVLTDGRGLLFQVDPSGWIYQNPQTVVNTDTDMTAVEQTHAANLTNVGLSDAPFTGEPEQDDNEESNKSKSSK